MNYFITQKPKNQSKLYTVYIILTHSLKMTYIHMKTEVNGDFSDNKFSDKEFSETDFPTPNFPKQIFGHQIFRQLHFPTVNFSDTQIFRKFDIYFKPGR